MSSEGLDPTDIAQAISDAKEKGFDVVQSAPNLLLLDLDTLAARKQYERVLPLVQRYWVAIPEETESKSGNTHVVIRLDEGLPLHVRLTLQAALGSDGVKEVLAVLRHSRGCEEPCLLFRPMKKKKVKK